MQESRMDWKRDEQGREAVEGVHLAAMHASDTTPSNPTPLPFSGTGPEKLTGN